MIFDFLFGKSEFWLGVSELCGFVVVLVFWCSGALPELIIFSGLDRSVV